MGVSHALEIATYVLKSANGGLLYTPLYQGLIMGQSAEPISWGRGPPEVATMDPREVFASLRAYCFERAKEIRDFIAGRNSFSLNRRETLKFGEMRRALEDQFAHVEETWNNLLKYARLSATDVDNKAAFGDLADVMKSTKRVMVAALLLFEQFTRASPTWILEGIRMTMLVKMSSKRRG